MIPLPAVEEVAANGSPIFGEPHAVDGFDAEAAARHYAEVVSEMMAAVFALTAVEPMQDSMMTFSEARGEEKRKTTQRGRVGRMPKSGLTRCRAKTSMAMAMRDARRISFKIAVARAENATSLVIDALRAEIVSTRRRCASPAYAKALREALPVACLPLCRLCHRCAAIRRLLICKRRISVLMR
jgi:hypothetical protein